MIEEWNIQSPGHQCARTQKPFEKDEPVYTILSMGPEGFRREDICKAAWQAAGGEQTRDKAGVVSFWEHPYVPPAPPSPEPLKKEDAESLLRAMLEKNLPEEKEVRYILAVMLERKRLFKHRETVRPAPTTDDESSEPRQGRGQSNILIYEHAKTGETFTIEDPHLKLDQIAAIQKRVAALLGSDASSGSSSPATEAEPPAASAKSADPETLSR